MFESGWRLSVQSTRVDDGACSGEPAVDACYIESALELSKVQIETRKRPPREKTKSRLWSGTSRLAVGVPLEFRYNSVVSWKSCETLARDSLESDGSNAASLRGRSHNTSNVPIDRKRRPGDSIPVVKLRERLYFPEIRREVRAQRPDTLSFDVSSVHFQARDSAARGTTRAARRTRG